MLVIPYPVIDPVAVQIGPIAIRWYAMAYLTGLIGGWLYARWLCRRPPSLVAPLHIDDFLTWATLGVVLGGRLGFVLFVRPGYFFDNPLAAFKIWQGGMAFHGGLLGVIVAGLIFCRLRKLPVLAFADIIACAAPIGLGLGRIANFINNELVGRITTVPWAIVYPGWGPHPRHPSQLYEAGMEGVALFVILFVLALNERVRRRSGLLSGVFLLGYGIFRTIAERFREMDAWIGILGPDLTLGQLLSLPMIPAGLFLIHRALNRPLSGAKPE